MNENEKDKDETNKTKMSPDDGHVAFAATVIHPSNQDSNPKHWLVDSESTVHITNSHVGVTN